MPIQPHSGKAIVRAGQDGEQSRAPYTDLSGIPMYLYQEYACVPAPAHITPESSIHQETHLSGVPLTFPARAWGDGSAHSIKAGAASLLEIELKTGIMGFPGT